MKGRNIKFKNYQEVCEEVRSRLNTLVKDVPPDMIDPSGIFGKV